MEYQEFSDSFDGIIEDDTWFTAFKELHFNMLRGEISLEEFSSEIEDMIHDYKDHLKRMSAEEDDSDYLYDSECDERYLGI